MRIRQLIAHVVRLTLNQPFTHASATRRESENVLIQCELEDGTTGWGEGVPRTYVTGETPAGCVAQLACTPVAEQFSGDCNDWVDVVRLCARFEPTTERDDPRGCYGNALRCAVELSILDAYGRLFGEPVGNVLQHVPEIAEILQPRSQVQYSAVIDAGAQSLWRKALVRRFYGFRDCKVKVGSQGDDDATRLRTIRRWIGPRMDLRVDANEAWHVSELPEKFASLREFGISCVEQPVPHAEVGGLAEIRKDLGLPVMLDESLTSEVDAAAAIAENTCDLFNIRLSKCGGFLASARLAAVAHAAGIGHQLGCHPGETGVLSAAGRHWACRVANIRYLEGSYDRHVFRRPLTNEDMTFGYGGRASAIERPGLGVTINEAALARLSVSRQEFAVA
jgi:L-alanine-DL-glutamate epimerase-like enolase superfamily enzyme